MFSARLVNLVFLFFVGLVSVSTVSAQEGGWPREIETGQGLITIYQPQPDSMDGNVLNARSAFSILPTGSEAQIFGVVWFESKLTRGVTSGELVIKDLSVADVHFPDLNEDQKQRLTTVIEQELPVIGLSIWLKTLKLRAGRFGGGSGWSVSGAPSPCGRISSKRRNRTVFMMANYTSDHIPIHSSPPRRAPRFFSGKLRGP